MTIATRRTLAQPIRFRSSTIPCRLDRAGILRYFEAAPGAPHWRGRCFVFDERLALDEQLQGAAA